MTNISLVQFMWLTTAICLVFILILRYKFNDSEKVVVRKKSPLPLTLEDKSENTLSFRTEILFVNEGTQCHGLLQVQCLISFPNSAVSYLLLCFLK